MDMLVLSLIVILLIGAMLCVVTERIAAAVWSLVAADILAVFVVLWALIAAPLAIGIALVFISLIRTPREEWTRILRGNGTHFDSRVRNTL